MDFIFAPDEKRSANIELEETFVPSEEEDATQSAMELIQRIKHEVKSSEHTQHEAIRAQFMSRLLDEVDELETDSRGIVGEMSFGEDVAYNTLFHYGFLKKV